MKAMVLAAGLGTRLAPLTNLRPKCLMPVMNRPLLGLWLERLLALGVESAVVNTHHLASRVREFLAAWPSQRLPVAQSHEPELLGTGGALVAARQHWEGQPFLLVNSDVLASADPLALAAPFKAGPEPLAVLGLVDAPRFNTVALDGQGRVLGFKGQDLPQEPARWLTYSGLAAIHPRLLDYLPSQGFSTLVEGLSAGLAAGESVLGRELKGYWDDLGTPERLLDLHRQLASHPPASLTQLAPPSPLLLAPGAVLEPGAQVEGFCVLGAGAQVQAGARVRDCLLLPGAQVLAGAQVEGAILGDGFVASGHIQGGAHA